MHTHLCRSDKGATEVIPAISVEHLQFSYPDGTEVFTDLSFSVTEGESVAIVGPNGVGKSTLLLALVGIVEGEGTIRLFGKRLEKRSLAEIRKSVGLVFQNPDDQLFCPTLYDDVAFGLRNMGLPQEEVHRRTLEALEYFGLADLAEKNSFHLSFGQKKAASIATVLAMEPRLLLLDEPTESLDVCRARALIQKIKGLSVTQLVVTHDLLLGLELCKRILVMNAGKIVADERRETIFSREEVLRLLGFPYDYRAEIIKRFWLEQKREGLA